jgi:opacity protein-like surface antigen
MKLARSTFTGLLALASLLTAAAPALAQSDSTKTTPPPAQPSAAHTGSIEYLGGGYFVGSFPTGDWGKIAGFGLGLDGTTVTRKPGKKFALRSNLGLLYNFSRTVDVPAGNLGPADKLNIETKNWSVFFGLGPEFSMPNKDMAPFVFGTVGFDTYWTKSELSGTALGTSYSANHGDNRIAFAWSAGMGFRRRIAAGHLGELSAEYRSGIRHDFLLPDDVHSNGGAVVAHRDSHSSDQILVRFGTVFGTQP